MGRVSHLPPLRVRCVPHQDEARNAALFAEFEGIQLDYSRQRVTPETMVIRPIPHAISPVAIACPEARRDSRLC